MILALSAAMYRIITSVVYVVTILRSTRQPGATSDLLTICNRYGM